MKRRTFIAGTIALSAAPSSGLAQPAGKVWRVGLLAPAPTITARKNFEEELRDLGYVEGRNLTFEPERFRAECP